MSFALLVIETRYTGVRGTTNLEALRTPQPPASVRGVLIVAPTGHPQSARDAANTEPVDPIELTPRSGHLIADAAHQLRSHLDGPLPGEPRALNPERAGSAGTRRALALQMRETINTLIRSARYRRPRR